jgi:hypothetical protein
MRENWPGSEYDGHARHAVCIFGSRHIVFAETRMSQNFRKAASLIALLCALSLGVAWGWSNVSTALGAMSMQRTSRASSLATHSEIDTTWRHTKLGWQDSAAWPAADTFAPQKKFELLHPFVWAAVVLITVIGTMIWASSEWEFNRLFENSDETDAQV